MDDHSTIPEDHKKCTKCGAVLPATAEYFHRRAASQDGLNAACKICRCADTRKWNLVNRDKKREAGRRWYRENANHVKEASHRWYEANRKRATENSRRWRENNQERVHQNYRRWLQNNQEQKKDYDRAYRKKHHERILERKRQYNSRNRERRLEYNRRWLAANPDKARENYRVQAERRRARLAGAAGTYTAADIRSQYALQRGRCWWCGELVGDRFHADHRVPLSRGGSNAPENIVISCPRCNNSKGAKLPHEWNGRLL